MLTPSEDKHCYASPIQREVLIELIQNGVVTEDFFLTGGTALSVFYLHHRQSNDLDFFTLQEMDLAQIDFLIKTTWHRDYVKIKDSTNFLSVLIRNVKVDFVIDRLSLHDERERYTLESLHHLRIDSLRNIVSNKFCTIVSRVEPKDYFDYYALCKALQITSFEGVLDDAREKDAIFDDPPTAAYQIEQGLNFVRQHSDTNPVLLVPLDHQDFVVFYERVIRWLYESAAKR